MNKRLYSIYALAFILGISPACALAVPNTGFDPFASPKAKKGGSFTTSWGDFPKSLNYYLDNNTFTAFVFSSFFDSLIQLDPVSESPIPGLAGSWEISTDKKVFTFHLDPAAR